MKAKLITIDINNCLVVLDLIVDRLDIVKKELISDQLDSATTSARIANSMLNRIAVLMSEPGYGCDKISVINVNEQKP